MNKSKTLWLIGVTLLSFILSWSFYEKLLHFFAATSDYTLAATYEEMIFQHKLLSSASFALSGLIFALIVSKRNLTISGRILIIFSYLAALIMSFAFVRIFFTEHVSLLNPQSIINTIKPLYVVNQIPLPYVGLSAAIILPVLSLLLLLITGKLVIAKSD